MPNLSQEAEIASEIDRLRSEFPKTQELYREVCALLFFRYGVTPTTNRLYQLVKKGSMSAPGEALNRFWKQLRDSSRLSVAAPDVPEGLREAAGQLAVTFWKTARQEAEASFETLRHESQAEVDEARAVLKAADQHAEAHQKLLEQQAVELAEEKTSSAELVAQVSVLKDELGLMANVLAARERDNLELSARLEESYGAHAKEIQSAHIAAAQIRDGFIASEQRFLVDLDRERTAGAKFQRLLESEQAGRRQDVEKLRSEIANLFNKMAAQLQSIGALEGQLAAAVKSQAETTLALEQRDAAITALTERCLRAELSREQPASNASKKKVDRTVGPRKILGTAKKSA